MNSCGRSHIISLACKQVLELSQIYWYDYTIQYSLTSIKTRCAGATPPKKYDQTYFMKTKSKQLIPCNMWVLPRLQKLDKEASNQCSSIANVQMKLHNTMCSQIKWWMLLSVGKNLLYWYNLFNYNSFNKRQTSTPAVQLPLFNTRKTVSVCEEA